MLLPTHHPLVTPQGYPALALVELAAQLAGRALAAPANDVHPLAGMLVELEHATVKQPLVPPCTLVPYRVTAGRSLGELHRFHVELQDILIVSLTLRIT